MVEHVICDVIQYQNCDSGHIDACMHFDDAIFFSSSSIYEVSQIRLVHDSYFFAVLLVTHVL